MATFLVIQSTYTAIECAIFKDRICLSSVRIIDKMVASRVLLSVIDELLTSHTLTSAHLDYAVVNLGPAPFTTLRVVVATMNGLQYAAGLQLIGINCFEAWFHEIAHYEYPAAIIMNAFGSEWYMALRLPNSSQFSYACLPISDALQQLSKLQAQKLVIAGNGVTLHKQLIEEQLGHSIIYYSCDRSMNSLDHLALVGLERWEAGTVMQEPLIPLYIKGSLTR